LSQEYLKLNNELVLLSQHQRDAKSATNTVAASHVIYSALSVADKKVGPEQDLQCSFVLDKKAPPVVFGGWKVLALSIP
jgi:hypothetical protein